MYPHEFAAKAMAEATAERDRGKRQAQVDSGPKEHGPERPKRSRGWSLENVLTTIRGPKPRSVSKDSISRPILDHRYPIQAHTPLLPLGQVSPSPSSPYGVSSPYTASPPYIPTPPNTVSSQASLPRLRSTPPRPAPPETPSHKGTLVRWNSAPDQTPEECYFPPALAKEIPKWLSDPKHSHAYPDLGRLRSPQPLRRTGAITRRRAHKERPAQRSLPEIHSQDSSCIVGPVGRTPPCPNRPPPPPPTSVERCTNWCAGVLREAEEYRTPESSRLTVQDRLDIATKKLSRVSELSQEPDIRRVQSQTLNLAVKMERSSLQPPPRGGTKFRAIQQAKEMEMLVAERAKRTGDEPPPYDFLELIGKGSYGRVFKGKNRATGGLVAIKVIDTDKADYEEMTTKNLQETVREINILQQLKDSRARPYVNIIEEARTVHNELWIVSEYASGGSVNTLMKPGLQRSKAGLEEKYIIPIARELALGLKYIHEAGVIHRDLKSNNILVLEDGRVQLCDFGVSGALEPEIAKRSTIVGTPNWMAPELKKEWVKDLDPSGGARPNEILYGSEVDIWAYGCTLYEMATGLPPFHQTKPYLLPEAGVPKLEGDKYSEELKSLVAFVLQPNPRERPTPDEILEHPYLADSTKMYPTVTLVALVEQYYRWEQAGGSRVSLFNPYGAQAPDPLAPETEDDDEDWTFSTTDEFEQQFAVDHSDPFSSASSTQEFGGMNAPHHDDDRFARLQASIRAEQADRGKRRLDRLFNTDSTPYRFSASDPDADRRSSDLALRDYNPGAPNRETVIDLDFAAPTAADIPSIDLGEVPTVKASRLNRLMPGLEAEEEEEEYQYDFDLNQTARRATREWKFPAMADESKRRTLDWKPPTPEKTNRRTMEWKFDYSMVDSQEPLPKSSRLSRRDTQELSAAPAQDTNRRTQDFVFPMRDPMEDDFPSNQGAGFSSSPTLGPGFRPTLRHATTEPLGSFDDYPQIISTPESPLRSSMIDLDMANIDDYRPTTSDSAATSTYTAGTDQLSGNPFDLEDQVHLSETNNRASYHMKSQSEPNHALPGLLTPQTYDAQGYPTNQDPHHPSMHARGVSSVSQMQPKPAPINLGYQRQRAQQPTHWDGWSHQEAFSTNESSPASVSPVISPEEDGSIDDRWDKLEKQAQQYRHRQFSSGFRSRRTTSQDDEPRSDVEDNYASESYDDTAARQSRVSVAPNGRPLVDFPIPRGPDLEALMGVDVDPQAMSNALWKSSLEMRDGLRASRDLLRSMRLSDMRPEEDAK